VLHGGAGTDTVRGGHGNDQLHSDSGADTLDGGPGDDVVFINNGTMAGPVDCGDGHDTIHVNPKGHTGYFSNLRALQQGRIRGCEVVLETAHVKDPTVGVKEMADSRGGETLRGGPLNDNLLGGPGPDTLLGADGNDVMWGNRLPDGPSLGTDVIQAGGGDDQVFGGRGANRIAGGAGNDFLQGGPGRNTIAGDEGDDTIRTRGDGPNAIAAGPGNDIVIAYAKGRATVDCGAGEDTVRIGFNRSVRPRRNCEHVTKRFNGRVSWAR
jgi:Ca2+-binding RTX toxin-like protein